MSRKALTLIAAQEIVAEICAVGWPEWISNSPVTRGREELKLAIRMFGEEPPKRGKIRDLVLELKGCWEQIGSPTSQVAWVG